MVVLEVWEPAGERERARYTWSRASHFCLISVFYVNGVGGGSRLRNIAFRAYKNLLLRGLLHRTG